MSKVDRSISFTVRRMIHFISPKLHSVLYRPKIFRGHHLLTLGQKSPVSGLVYAYRPSLKNVIADFNRRGTVPGEAAGPTQRWGESRSSFTHRIGKVQPENAVLYVKNLRLVRRFPLYRLELVGDIHFTKHSLATRLLTGEVVPAMRSYAAMDIHGKGTSIFKIVCFDLHPAPTLENIEKSDISRKATQETDETIRRIKEAKETMRSK